MRRLPIYFLVDVSESMVGEPIKQVENGMRQIVQELRTDPYALETAFISVIAFAGKAKSLSPLTELSSSIHQHSLLAAELPLAALLTF